MSITLETRFLFRLLLKFLQPDLVCDIGSMDGSDAKRFRRYVPGARIIAFEANPSNISLIEQDGEIRRQRVEVQQNAVWNKKGGISFFIEDIASGGVAEEVRRGISSTRPRTENSLGNREIVVESVRLDDFIMELAPEPEHIALWIDVEGSAYEVLEGMEVIRDRVEFVLVEVETKEYWQGQRLKDDVVDLMASMGFAVLARSPVEEQHDLLLINERTLARHSLRCKIPVFVAYLMTGRIALF